MKNTTTTIEKDIVESIKSFEEIHKKYLEEDGRLNSCGWNYLHDAEINWGDDIKWNDHIKYHMQPRIESYWENPDEDIEYKEHWKKAHPKLYEKYMKELWN